MSWWWCRWCCGRWCCGRWLVLAHQHTHTHTHTRARAPSDTRAWGRGVRALWVRAVCWWPIKSGALSGVASCGWWQVPSRASSIAHAQRATSSSRNGHPKKDRRTAHCALLDNNMREEEEGERQNGKSNTTPGLPIGSPTIVLAELDRA